jgi:hypothetical protein
MTYGRETRVTKKAVRERVKDSNKYNKNTGLEVIFIEFKDKSWSTTGFFISMQLPALSELDVPLVCPHIVK